MVAYQFLPIAPLPQIDFPTIQVQASLPGVDPETAATSLAAPLERRFAQIAGRLGDHVQQHRSAARSITIQFDLDRDINGAARDVQAAINAAGGELPLDLPNPPTYRKVNPADSPVMILAHDLATRCRCPKSTTSPTRCSASASARSTASARSASAAARNRPCASRSIPPRSPPWA